MPEELTSTELLSRIVIDADISRVWNELTKQGDAQAMNAHTPIPINVRVLIAQRSKPAAVIAKD